MVRKNIIESDNAVSEVVDVVLILGIMLIAITVITVAGFPALQNLQESGHKENIRQSFIVLGENVNKVVFDNAPSQSVELKMYGGGIWVTSDSHMNMTLQTWNSSIPAKENQTAIDSQMRSLQNEFEGTTISYENTGVWAKYQTGDAVMVREPQFVFNDNLLVIPFAPIRGTDGIAGEGLIRVIAREDGVPSVYSYQNVSAVDITIKSVYYTAWEDYLRDTLEMQVEVNNTESSVHAHKDYTENIDVHVLKSSLDMSIE
ncbi:hypothetical protein SAMN04488587_0435 [Methanococcoides vulcani]|uniref:Archaeal Type IV pilin N-terminal domain-containing protein n=1 Tax=Methanococcoides vulcani TaxID=1353158 RepID=A0A1H9YCF4_9EURY|nr:hypothetical protein [Methanococcoides vulcani]SES66603.1 hypothetical protein SAMN04488587_0435 [Methanococcoides vulcani]